MTFNLSSASISKSGNLLQFLSLSLLVTASVMSLRSIVYVDLLGIGRLTNTYGMVTAVMGIGITVGTPLAGFLKNFTGNYMWTFIMSGVAFLIAGILHFLLPIVMKWEESEPARRNSADDDE